MLEHISQSCLPIMQQIHILRKKWKYRGEGNANLVIALPQEKVILRLHKSHKDAIIKPEMQSEEEDHVRREALFCTFVMVPLLGRAYIQPPIPAIINSAEIRKLHDELLHHRPESRHHKVVRCGNVTIYPDYTLLPEWLYQKFTSLYLDAPITTNYINSNKIFELRCEHISKEKDIDGLARIRINDDKRSPINSAHIKYPTAPSKCRNKRLCPLIMKRNFDSNFHNLLYQNQLPLGLKSTPTYCVEIKPKQGWLPSVDRRYPKCTFCLNQFLKLANHTVKVRSEYCPLDLFSGDSLRMKKAIGALLKTPQNNLKIFKDGQLVYSEESNSDVATILQQWLEPSALNTNSKWLVEKFTCLVHNALTSNLLDEDSYPKIAHPTTSLPSPEYTDRIPLRDLSALAPPCDWSSSPLPKNCILDRILRIQKLEKTGSENIYKMYKSVVNKVNDYDYVENLGESDHNNLSLDNLQCYLLATTAKDCSILIAFQSLQHLKLIRPVCCDKNIAQDLDGVNYLWNIGVSDLDPKPLSCIEKHKKRDCDVITACTKFLENSLSLRPS
uniref:Inositol-pentakisphosphate 2-kinase n=2 Tax=Clastoptera arizonana TaxID=38151 RepID=A0A1B6DR31_9HEMI